MFFFSIVISPGRLGWSAETFKKTSLCFTRKNKYSGTEWPEETDGWNDELSPLKKSMLLESFSLSLFWMKL